MHGLLTLALALAIVALLLPTTLATSATFHDYPSMSAAAFSNNPPFCAVPWASLDLSRVVAFGLASPTDCGRCLRVCGVAGCADLLVVDRCTVLQGHLDISTGAGMRVVGDTAGMWGVSVNEVDAENCRGVWSGRMFFDWDSPMGKMGDARLVGRDVPAASPRWMESMQLGPEPAVTEFSAPLPENMLLSFARTTSTPSSPSSASAGAVLTPPTTMPDKTTRAAPAFLATTPFRDVVESMQILPNLFKSVARVLRPEPLRAALSSGAWVVPPFTAPPSDDDEDEVKRAGDASRNPLRRVLDTRPSLPNPLRRVLDGEPDGGPHGRGEDGDGMDGWPVPPEPVMRKEAIATSGAAGLGRRNVFARLRVGWRWRGLRRGHLHARTQHCRRRHHRAVGFHHFPRLSSCLGIAVRL
ncbi:hypothetical protein BJ546DRAFT_41211 [Cryomyces antarcticus]